MNKAATATLIPVVAIVVALGGCTTMNPPAALVPGQTGIGGERINFIVKEHCRRMSKEGS